MSQTIEIALTAQEVSALGNGAACLAEAQKRAKARVSAEKIKGFDQSKFTACWPDGAGRGDLVVEFALAE